jgi:hypothetical protein
MALMGHSILQEITSSKNPETVEESRLCRAAHDCTSGKVLGTTNQTYGTTLNTVP